MRSFAIVECRSQIPAHFKATLHESKESDSGQLMVCTHQLIERVLGATVGKQYTLQLIKGCHVVCYATEDCRWFALVIDEEKPLFFVGLHSRQKSQNLCQ